MDFDLSQVAALPPSVARAVLPDWLGGYVDAPEARRAAFVAVVRAELAAASEADLRGLLDAFARSGEEYRLYPANPLARRVSRACMATLIDDGGVFGLERFRAAAAGPCLVLCNHLSYVDTQATDLLLSRNGAEDLADRLVVVAGPKVYETPFRRVAAISLNTLKTAQSAHVAANTAELSPREIGRIALETVRQVGERLAQGDPVLVYAEGSRTRTGRMQPFLRAVSKYVALPGTVVLPASLVGTDRLFPVEAEAMRPAEVRIRFGEPLSGGDPATAREILEETWRRVAAGLPAEYRPAEGTPAVL